MLPWAEVAKVAEVAEVEEVIKIASALDKVVLEAGTGHQAIYKAAGPRAEVAGRLAQVAQRIDH